MAEGFGAFGKMPSVGDFFRLNVPGGFVSVWDGWVQQALLDTQAALGPDWDKHYMSAPIWRFGLSAGLAGPNKVLGVMMPSVDRVGRRFPLTLMAALPTAGPVQLDHFSEEPLFQKLENLALDTLEDGMSRDLLEQRLNAIKAPPFRAFAPVRGIRRSLVLTQSASGGILPELASGLLADRFARPSIWSAAVNDVQRLLICDGLPDGPDMQALFDLTAPVWTEARPL